MVAFKRILAFSLAIILCFGMFTAVATEEESTNVTISASIYDGDFILPRQELSVSPNTAESFGYTDSDDGVTVLDAIVALHSLLLEEAFTEETASAILTVEENGYITTIFGDSAAYFMFMVNGRTPNDGVYNESYHAYSAYTAGQALLSEGDVLECIYLQDSAFGDYYTWFSQSEVGVEPENEVTLTLKGYLAAYYGASREEDIPIMPMKEYKILSGSDKNALTDSGQKTDENGRVTLSFSVPGTYYISAQTQESSPIVAPWCVVNVSNFDFTVPKNATLFVGTKTAHYVPFKETKSVCVTENDDETKTYSYILSNGGVYNYRVSIPGKAPVAGKFTYTDGQAPMIVDEEALTADKTSVVRNDGYYEANLLLTANAAGHITLETGDRYNLAAMRAWQIVDNTINNYYIEPDFTYEVLQGDSVTISDKGVIEAVREGTSIIKVTYDAITAYDHLYSASWPENVGIVAVTVGGAQGPDTGITLDAEFDSIYYASDEEYATLTFTPETETEVYVLNPVIRENTVSYGEFQSVSANDNGTYSVHLTHGRNIIKVTKGGAESYRVVTARPITITLTNETEEGRAFAAGDTVKATFNGLSIPVPKMASAYNFVNKIVYTAPDTTTVESEKGQYNFILNRSITFTLPQDFDAQTGYKLTNGHINVSGWGEVIGDHREIDPLSGRQHNFDSEKQDANVSYLPDITVKCEPEETPRPIQPSNPSNRISVKFRLIGDTKHEDGTEDHDEYVTWIKTKTYKVTEGSTAADLMKKALKDAKLSVRGLDDGYITGIKAPSSVGGYWLEERTNGPSSGWMYTVNGDHPNVSSSEYVLESGDVVILHYTDDYMLEIGFGNEEPEYFERWLEAKDVDPGDYDITVSTKPSSKPSPTSKPEPTPVPTQKPKEQTFTDVPDDHWAKEFIEKLAEEGIVTGFGDGSFAPDKGITRAEIVTILARISGKNPTDTASMFEDVKPDDWYAPYVVWAAESGITNGTGEAVFSPDMNISRQDMAVMLVRFVTETLGVVLPQTTDEFIFSDCDDVADYAKDAVTIAQKAGIISGYPDGTFMPNNTVTRAEAAKMICALVELIK